MFRDEYSSAELWQMGVLLLGMPLAAVLGSMLGLVGKWRKGRVVTAALIGMGCASFVSCTLFLCFVFISTFANNTRRRVLLDLFDAELGEQLTRNAMIATGAISLLAAIGLRLRYRDEATGAAAVNMRQLLLLQVFTVVVLGCWTGMRFIAIERVSYLERASRKWTKREWGVEGDRDGNPASLRFAAFGPTADYRAFNQSLALAAEEPWLKGLELNWVTRPDQLELSKLSASRSLKTLHLLIQGQPAIVQQNVDDLGKITSLEFLHITNGDLFKGDLSPVTTLPRLNSLQLSGVLIDVPTFNVLASSSSIEAISLEHVQFTSAEPIRLPPQLADLVVHAATPVPIDNASFAKLSRLKRIRMFQPGIGKKELALISQIGSLESLHLSSVETDVDLNVLRQCKELQRLQIAITSGVGFDKAATFRNQLLDLATLPKLRVIHCPVSLTAGGYLPELNDRFEALVMARDSDRIDKLRGEFEELLVKVKDEFQEQIHEIRTTKKLDSLHIQFESFRPTRALVDRKAVQQGKGGGS